MDAFKQRIKMFKILNSQNGINSNKSKGQPHSILPINESNTPACLVYVLYLQYVY